MCALMHFASCLRPQCRCCLHTLKKLGHYQNPQPANKLNAQPSHVVPNVVLYASALVNHLKRICQKTLSCPCKWKNTTIERTMLHGCPSAVHLQLRWCEPGVWISERFAVQLFVEWSRLSSHPPPPPPARKESTEGKPMSAFIGPDGVINPIFRSYLMEN